MVPHGEAPSAEHVPADRRHLIMYACLEGSGAMLMGGDSPSEEFEKPHGICVMLPVEDPAAAERIFHALAEGGTVQMPIEKTFWSDRFGMLIDRFNIPWMINCEKTG